MNPERKQEIKSATSENPAHLTQEEMLELRDENPNRLQHDIGAGLVTIPIEPGSYAARAVDMKAKGMNSAAIALELEMSVTTIRRLLDSADKRRHGLANANAKSMYATGYSNAEIADHLGLTESRVRTILKGK